MIPKNELRQHYQKIRDSLPDEKREKLSLKIQERLLKVLEEESNPGILGLYWSIQSEVQTHLLISLLLEHRVPIALPKIENNTLQFYSVTTLKNCQTGAYGILEPKENCFLLVPEQIKTLIVPGIVFDERGYRLGYGKGYYDQFLAETSDCFTLGLTYSSHLVPILPREPHDIAVNQVLSDSSA